MPKQFWVIGGEYRDTDFNEIDPATSHVFGPFGDYDSANVVWRERSMEHRAKAYVRYAIVCSAPNPRAQISVAA
jgi:Domain of unknown function (DUF4170)